MAGIYIHIPFCKQKCTYCDFHFSTTFESYRSQMIDAIVKEIDLRSSYLNDAPLNSIYFGGGTPSLLNSVELNLILNQIKNTFYIAENVEITIETNPDDVYEDNLELWRKSGINRLSIGLQSFKSSDLEWMNRAHTANESLTCVQKANSYGFDNLTIDLMYGLPGLTDEEWENHIRTAVGLGVSHISAYCLTVEENTVLSKWVKNKKILPLTEVNQSDQFIKLIDVLEELGFDQYEISNFCKPGCEAVHNTNYWKSQPYLGVGPSAHSFNGEQRSWNIRNNTKYIKLINTGEGFLEYENLTVEDRYNELLMTGLRTKYGVNLKELDQLCKLDSIFFKNIETLILEGVMIKNNSTITLTKKGRLMADRIASDLFIIK